MLSNERFLVYMIDDDQEDQTFFFMALERISMTVDCAFANSGPEAIKRFLSDPGFRPDMIFIDVNMPVMNGIECLTELRKMERLLSVPIYAYSTSNDERMVREALQEGATGVLQKQPGIEALKEMLSETFAQHPAFITYPSRNA